MMDYSKTLNLPKTNFPMRANLPVKEKEILKFWEDIDIYNLSCKEREGAPTYILHDGPPYSNGNIHIGHALNKILKDIIIKYKTMQGFKTPYVPGWDTHGLPIEIQAIKTLNIDKEKITPLELRKKCKETAEHYINVQREQFIRLGVRGDWKNPYITLLPHYEAKEILAFGKMVEAGSVYRALQPVYWCWFCETSLAEAEIEYEDKSSPSIYVKFKVVDNIPSLSSNIPTFFVIWTTTPWTLPANVAIALSPNLEYSAVKVNGEILIIADGLVLQIAEKLNIKNYEIIKKFKGKELEGIKTKHPFVERYSSIILADYVSCETGTGCVHIAPGHGWEDYLSGLQYNLPIISPVDKKGKFTEEFSFACGEIVFDANKKIIEKMKEDNTLIHQETITHSYPHCWRCSNPIIFRATEQWFISFKDFLKLAEEEIKKVKWIPPWGKDRILNMVKLRPNWCISRQRAWGVPIPAFYCKTCGEIILNKEVIEIVSSLFEKEGSDAWFKYDASKILNDYKCPKCNGNSFTKESDILDVWFDSGSSHFSVLSEREDLAFPADMYLEGTDQYRGWYQSSLWISLFVNGHAPYKEVLTHGFVVDELGRKMSKSLGNVIDPQEIVSKYGADILRSWVAYSDFRSDVKISENILLQIIDAYRKIRNTLRFLLGNLYDYDVKTDAVDYNNLREIDKYILGRLQEIIERVTTAYDNFEFHTVFHTIYNFCVVDLSSLYFDILKDCLYTFAKNSKERRSAQTVLYEILISLTKLLSPILTFTTEEVYQHIQNKEKQSIQLCDFPKPNPNYKNNKIKERFEKLIKIRDIVNCAIETKRKEGIIGSSLEAEVEIFAEDENIIFLKSFGRDNLKEFFIVSDVKITHIEKCETRNIFESEEFIDIKIKVERAKGEKCARCWNFSLSTNTDSEYPQICKRCIEVLKNAKQ